MSAVPSKAGVLSFHSAGGICKPTTQHSMILDTTYQNVWQKNAELEHTLGYWAAQVGTRVLELENHCARKRFEGSNPSLSASTFSRTHSKADITDLRADVSPWPATDIPRIEFHRGRQRSTALCAVRHWI